MSSSTGDELCDACAKLDLYSLFTGPRHYVGRPELNPYGVAHVTTLLGVISNTKCPLCRLIKHDLHTHSAFDPAYYHKECDPAKIQCCLRALRADYLEDTSYQNPSTQEMMATKLQVRLVGSDTCSWRELSCMSRIPLGSGIRLLSPESVFPARPLLNGFCAMGLERGLSLLKQWIGTCETDHTDTCQFNPLDCMPPGMGLDSIRVIDVRDRSLRAFDPRLIKYATLSYVFGEAGDEHLKLLEAL
ncbi:hypothetical protein PG994_009455 [Apiospora phragmitis]|uniref:Uncharacterized protein n=1 Tax=Apiospora phragmitis TaxID=2905665 RepID=A0ABR1UJC2_9PEZI